MKRVSLGEEKRPRPVLAVAGGFWEGGGVEFPEAEDVRVGRGAADPEVEIR